MQRHRIRLQRILRKPIPQTLAVVLHIQRPRLTIQLAQRHAEQPRPQIPTLHRLRVDALDLRRRPPVAATTHHTAHRVVRATNPVLRHRPSLVQLLIETHRRLRHLHRSHPIRQDLTRLKPQIDAVRQLPLRPEQRTVVQRHRIMLVVPHRGHAQLKRSQYLTHPSRTEPPLVLDLIREIHERTLPMVVRQFHRVPQIQIHSRRTVKIHLPLPSIRLPIHLPHDHPIGVARVSDPLTQLLRVILTRRTRNVVVLLRVPTDPLDRLRVRLPTKLASHALVGTHTHRHHMHRPVRILQIRRVRRHHEIHRIHRLKPNPLVPRIPETLHHPTPTHQRVIHPAQHLIHKVRLLPNLVVEPVLRDLRVRIQLLPHRHKAGHNIHPQRLLQE